MAAHTPGSRSGPTPTSSSSQSLPRRLLAPPPPARERPPLVPLSRRQDRLLPSFPSAGAKTTSSTRSPLPAPRSVLPLPPRGCRELDPLPCLPTNAAIASPSTASPSFSSVRVDAPLHLAQYCIREISIEFGCS